MAGLTLVTLGMAVNPETGSDGEDAGLSVLAMLPSFGVVTVVKSLLVVVSVEALLGEVAGILVVELPAVDVVEVVVVAFELPFTGPGSVVETLNSVSLSGIFSVTTLTTEDTSTPRTLVALIFGFSVDDELDELGDCVELNACFIGGFVVPLVTSSLWTIGVLEGVGAYERLTFLFGLLRGGLVLCLGPS